MIILVESNVTALTSRQTHEIVGKWRLMWMLGQVMETEDLSRTCSTKGMRCSMFDEERGQGRRQSEIRNHICTAERRSCLDESPRKNQAVLEDNGRRPERPVKPLSPLIIGSEGAFRATRKTPPSSAWWLRRLFHVMPGNLWIT